MNSFGSTPENRQRPGVEPESWEGSNLNQKNLASVSKSDLVTQVDGRTSGSKAVKLLNIKPSSLSSLIAPGFISFGTPWVYPSSKSANADGGIFGGMAFTNKPDAVKATISVSSTEGAHIIAYLWNGTFKSKIGDKSSPSYEVEDVDRAVMGKITPTSSGKLIASCDYSTTSTSGWEEVTVPLTYADGVENETPAKVNVILSAADYWNRDNMEKDNYMLVDDVQFVYYHALSDLTYDGTTISGFAEGTTSYDLSTVKYEASKVSYTKKGVGATVETVYDEANAVLTITVKGNDYASDNTSVTTYTVQFKKPTTTYEGNLVVVVNGANTEPQAANILLTEQSDGKYTFSLKNFVLSSADGDMPIGNIVLPNLTMTEENGVQTIETNQTITITEGDDTDYEYWLGPGLEEVPVDLTATITDGTLVCTIDIDMMESLEQIINVYFAPGLKAVGDQNAPTGEGSKTDFVFCRQFSTGWSTLCLPFDFDANDFVSEGVTVNLQEFTGIAQDGGLKFSKVSELQGTANTPYLIYVSEDASAVIYYSDTQLEKAEPKAVTFGAYGFTGNYEPSFDMQGKYGVATVDVDGTEVQKILVGGKDSYLDGLRAYFTSTTAAANGMAIHFDEGQTTGIVDARGNITEDGAAYNLQGVRVANSAKALPKGVYVVNGKKVIR